VSNLVSMYGRYEPGTSCHTCLEGFEPDDDVVGHYSLNSQNKRVASCFSHKACAAEWARVSAHRNNKVICAPCRAELNPSSILASNHIPVEYVEVDIRQEDEFVRGEDQNISRELIQVALASIPIGIFMGIVLTYSTTTPLVTAVTASVGPLILLVGIVAREYRGR